MEQSERLSRFRKFRGDGMLLKLNRSALNILVGDDNRPLRFWLDQGKRALKTAEEAMNADASDLKTAYVHFTKAAVILSEVIPQADDFFSYQTQYELLKDSIIPAISVESDKLWELLVFREGADPPRHEHADSDPESEMDPYNFPPSSPPPPFNSQSTPPYIKAVLHLKDELITFLLPSDLTFTKIIEQTRFALNRRCYSTQTISEANLIQLCGPMGLKEVICNEDDMDEVLDKFQDAFDLQQEVKASGKSPEILQQDELPPSYDFASTSTGTTNPVQDRGRRRSSVDVLEDFGLRDMNEELFLDGMIISLEISLW